MEFQIISLLIALIAVVISVATLQQNKDMIEASTRPYVVVYYKYTNFQNIQHYIIAKNFGKSSATITGFSSEYDLSKCNHDETKIPFDHLVGTTLAPGQSIFQNIKFKENFSDIKSFNFDIEYTCCRKKYSETYTVNLEIQADAPSMRAKTPDKELEIISFTLQDFVEKQL